MNRKKILSIFLIIAVLFSVGYALMNNWATAEENGIVEEENGAEENGEVIISPEDEEEEVEDAEKLFGKLVKRLEKAELKLTKAPASLVITSKVKVTMVNVKLEAIGTVTQGKEDALTVRIHGLTLEVDASGAKIYGGGKKITLSDLTVGNILLIKGTMDEDTGVIEASRIYNRSSHKKSLENLRVRIQDLLRRIEELRARLQAIQGR